MSEDLDSASAREASGDLIAHLAGRGDIARRWEPVDVDHARLKPWQRGLLTALDLDARRYPSATVSALGRGESSACVDWLHAEPIHLAAGLNEVALVPLRREVDLTTHERDSMSAALRDHLASEDLVLSAAGDSGWLIGSRTPFAIDTVVSEYASKNEWNVVLPYGRDAPRIRRLMTELQMLLHEHPVNEARAARGLPAANAVWLWGNGALDTQHAKTGADCIGDDDYLRGVCRANEWGAPGTPDSAEAVIDAASGREKLVCLLKPQDRSCFEANWLTPLTNAIEHGLVARLELVLDEWLLTIDRWRLRRFWRRAMPMNTWVAP